MGNSYNYDTLTTTSQRSPVIILTALGLSLLFLLLTVIGRWKVYKKAGRHGIASIIPVWNEITFFQVGSGNGWTGMVCVLLSVALEAFWYVVNQLSANPTLISMANSNNTTVTAILGASCATVLLLLWFNVSNTHKLSKNFGKGFGTTLGLILLPEIFYLVLGFGRAEYDPRNNQENLPAEDFEPSENALDSPEEIPESFDDQQEVQPLRTTRDNHQGNHSKEHRESSGRYCREGDSRIARNNHNESREGDRRKYRTNDSRTNNNYKERRSSGGASRYSKTSQNISSKPSRVPAQNPRQNPGRSQSKGRYDSEKSRERHGRYSN